MILARERETYDAIWALPAYAEHSPGAGYLPIFLDMVQTKVSLLHGRSTMGASVLDAGCGSGKGALALETAGFHVTLCDLTDAGLTPEAKRLPFVETPLWADLKQMIGFRDFVYCTDVLEHIPPTFTMLVVHRLLQVARKGVFLSIALGPDGFGAWIGKPLHQTVQSFTQWRDQLGTIAHVVESRDLLNTGIFLIEPC